jgi:lycopene beta-cyclase
MSVSSVVSKIASSKTYDYIFSGYGAAASLLILKLHHKNLLDKLNILIVDPERKNKNDKTFCFWANEDEDIVKELKHLIKHSWSNVLIQNAGNTPLAPLTYHHISSIDLYDELLKLEKSYNWDRLISAVDKVSSDENGAYIVAKGEIIRGNKVFDSRTPIYEKIKEGETHIFQSFVGWEIETSRLIENPDTCRLMDFDVEQKGSTQFMYVLPFSPTTALVELTRFGSEILCETAAEKQLQDYIHKHFGEFKKQAIEIGCIPMSNAEIKNDTLKDVVLLGARNYKVKPSTGYAFKNMYHHASELVNSISNLKNPKELNVEHAKAPTGRFAFYDSLLLHILKNKPQNGKIIFQDLLKGVEINTVLRFLDEKTSFSEDLKIFAKLPWPPFLSALFYKITQMSWFRPFILMLLCILLIFLGKGTFLQSFIGYGLLITGLITVGIPHGAVDHLIETGKWDSKKVPRFILTYLLKAAAMAFLWYLFPELAIIIFLVYSSWHFGQADGKQWGFSPVLSFIWGVFLLFYILGTHMNETNSITSIIGHLKLPIAFPSWVIIPWIIWSIIRKQTSFSLTLIWLLLSSQLPLLFAFGLYFIGQHSITSWKHISAHLELSNRKIWLNSLPFHAGAWIILMLFIYFYPVSKDFNLQDTSQWGIFFIFIACISLPHVISMQSLYTKKNTE